MLQEKAFSFMSKEVMKNLIPFVFTIFVNWNNLLVLPMDIFFEN
jgi:hypothetical protein